MLRQQIYEDMIGAMKAKETVKLEAVRFVWSEIKNAEIDAKRDLTDEEVSQILRREVKKRKEAIELMRRGGREELAVSDEAKLIYIENYLPKMMSWEEVEAVVDKIVARGQKDFGGVMGAVMAEVKGKADGKMVSEVVKEKLG
jgi:hypothetical protein